MLRQTLFAIAAVLVLAEATEVRKCSNTKSLGTIQEVDITNCEKTPCKLRRKTRVAIIEKFVPDHDVKSLVTSVHATILGIPLPFIGVDGTNACNNIYTTDDVKAPCPLTAGIEYIYKNDFPILDVYPKVSLVVSWALVENSNTITCFEAPSKITS